MLYFVVVGSLASVYLVFLRLIIEKRLRIARLKESDNKILFLTDRRIIVFLIESLILMMIPYPTLVGKSAYIKNTETNIVLEYHINSFLFILSISRPIYFGYYLVTLSKFWSSSAQRIA